MARARGTRSRVVMPLSRFTSPIPSPCSTLSSAITACLSTSIESMLPLGCCLLPGKSTRETYPSTDTVRELDGINVSPARADYARGDIMMGLWILTGVVADRSYGRKGKQSRPLRWGGRYCCARRPPAQPEKYRCFDPAPKARRNHRRQWLRQVEPGV